MADEAKILQRLLLAVYAVNQAAQQPQTSRLRKIKAVRAYCHVLHDVVNCESMWKRLAEQAAAADPPAQDDDAWALFTTAAEPLLAAHAKVLRCCGYAVPPPPTTNKLVADTRAYVLGENSTPKWGEQHVEEARAYLGAFVVEVEGRIKWWGSGVDAALMRCRRSGSVGLLVLLVSQGEVKLGDEFDIAFGLSLTEFVNVEITVPAPWAEVGLVNIFQAMVVNSQMANLTHAMDDGGVDRSSPTRASSLDQRLAVADLREPNVIERDGIEQPPDAATLGLGPTEIEPESIEPETRSATLPWDETPRVARGDLGALPLDRSPSDERRWPSRSSVPVHRGPDEVSSETRGFVSIEDLLHEFTDRRDNRDEPDYRDDRTEGLDR